MSSLDRISFGQENDDKGDGFVSSGHRNRVPHTGDINGGHLFFTQFWRLQVQGQGDNRVGLFLDGRW